MAPGRPLSDQGLRRARASAQGLQSAGRLAAVDLVRHLTGVQAQVLSAAGLALRARTQGLEAEHVRRARLEERSVVMTWAMRGTLHLIAAEDYGWLIPLVIQPRLANATRRLQEEGVPADQPPKAVRLIEAMLDREGPLTRREIADRLRRQGIVTGGQAIAHLVWLAAGQGVICYGPDRGGEQCFVLVRDWLAPSQPKDREVALAELALRYLQAHGPAEPADLAFWSGLRQAEARLAWQAVQHRLVAVETRSGTLWALPGQPDAAAAVPVRLLPVFDEYLLGWRNRHFAVQSEHWRRINRGGGWLHPVVLHDGRAVGTWATARTSTTLQLEVRPFDRLAPSVARGALAEARDVGRFLDVPVEPRLA
jgi:Winged helix DNA-binding domain